MTDFTLGTVVSSRIRLARNINGYPFPARLKSDGQAKEIIRSVSAAVIGMGDFHLKYMDDISEDEALNMVENRQISPALLRTPSRSAVLLNESEGLSIMVNEEDHLREQCISSGMTLRASYELLSAKDTKIGKSIPFAYDERLGYLTACPTNLGTGLRASVMMFLPALYLGGTMSEVINSATRLGLTVRGAYGEGSEAEGYTYQVSNEVTLGVTEETIIASVEEVVKKIIEIEASERERLRCAADAVRLKDKCLRAYGVLTSCALLSSSELDKLCADLKLAACLGYLKISDMRAVDELTLQMKPSNVHRTTGGYLTPDERDAYRAKQVTKEIKKIVISN